MFAGFALSTATPARSPCKTKQTKTTQSGVKSEEPLTQGSLQRTWNLTQIYVHSPVVSLPGLQQPLVLVEGWPGQQEGDPEWRQALSGLLGCRPSVTQRLCSAIWALAASPWWILWASEQESHHVTAAVPLTTSLWPPHFSAPSPPSPLRGTLSLLLLMIATYIGFFATAAAQVLFLLNCPYSLRHTTDFPSCLFS